MGLQAEVPVEVPAGGEGWAAPVRGGGAWAQTVPVRGPWGTVSAQDVAPVYPISEAFLATPQYARSVAHL
jgi:hypothetical protein